MNRKTVFTGNRDPMDDKPRYETCEQCGQRWNVSRQARLYAGVYVCPTCTEENRRKRATDLGRRLRTCRERRGVPAYVVSELVGVSRDMVRRYESGTARPTADVLRELADYYDVSTDWLLGREK